LAAHPVRKISGLPVSFPQDSGRDALRKYAPERDGAGDSGEAAGRSATASAGSARCLPGSTSVRWFELRSRELLKWACSPYLRSR
jgi:hypothetical protein